MIINLLLKELFNSVIEMKVFLNTCRYLTSSQRLEIGNKLSELLRDVNLDKLRNELMPTLVKEKEQLLAEQEKLRSDFDKQTTELNNAFNEKKQMQDQIRILEQKIDEKTSEFKNLQEEKNNIQKQLESFDRKIDERESVSVIAKGKDAEVRQIVEQKITELVFGISNKIRNRLGIAQSNIEILLQNRKIDNTAAVHLNILLKQIEYLENNLKEINEFAQPIIPILKEVELTQLLDKALTTLTAFAQKRNVHIEMNYSRPAAKVLVDEKMILESFIQVALNGIEAMPKGGTLSVTVSVSEDKKTASVIFSDTGTGIDPSLMDHIGKPFFTTKSNSSGLGLAMTQKMLSALNGTFSIISTSSLGTKVSITLPIR